MKNILQSGRHTGKPGRGADHVEGEEDHPAAAADPEGRAERWSEGHEV